MSDNEILQMPPFKIFFLLRITVLLVHASITGPMVAVKSDEIYEISCKSILNKSFSFYEIQQSVDHVICVDLRSSES